MPSTTMKKLTPVLVMRAVEPSLEFWEQRFGFTRTVDLPHEAAIGFAILVKDGVELMLQSEASVRADFSAGDGPVDGNSAALFLEIEDLDAVERALEGYPITMARRTTFYGMHEIGVREPGGHFVIFAQPSK
ncbi:MAG: VOC family protein [Gemmatimonadaceae bacterium]